MSRARVTLKDVAERAGVHLSTVSRAINPRTRGLVRDDVTKRVLKIADEMGYQTNPFAYSLKTNKSFSIGVLIPDISNPLFPPMIRGVEKTLAANGYTAILADSDEDMETEKVILGQMRARQVDGLILATAHRADDVVNACLGGGIPFVLLNRTMDNEDVYSVTSDDMNGIQQAVDHLVELGHRRIAHVAGPQDLSTGRDRLRGFRTAMRKNGLKPDPGLIVVCKAFSEEEGQRGAATLLDRGGQFTAIVAGGDLLALGCYSAFEDRGIDCPGDISVTGFSGMPFVEKFRPSLTTVHIPHYEMGVKAATVLLDLLDGGSPPHSIRYRPELIVRGSTAPAAR